MAKPRKLRVMIADDEAHVRKYIRAVLSRMNCDIVAEAENGKESIEKYVTFRPHILLLDINMPVKSGKAALSEIMAEYPKAFVMMLTSLSDKDTIEQCIALGASGYLRKDLNLEQMLSAIKESWRYYKANKHKPSS